MGLARYSPFALALLVVLIAGGVQVGIAARDGHLETVFLHQGPALKVTGLVIQYMRADPCNHPDAASARAIRTTQDGIAEVLRERWRPDEGCGNTNSDATPVWMVEMRGDIPVLGIQGNPAACGSDPMPSRVLALVEDGEVTTEWGTADR